MPPDLASIRREADGELDAQLVAAPPRQPHASRSRATRDGPLGLGAWHHRSGEDAEVARLPGPARGAAARARRAARPFRRRGPPPRGPLGLGTEFESIRDYVPDDDFRQVNWRATDRLGRPMSNQYRIERDRDVVCLVDCGRLMAAPLADRTRLDAALDAAVAVAAVADVLGDRCGAIAFDREVRRSPAAAARRRRAVVAALFDLEPRAGRQRLRARIRADRGAKRAFVLVSPTCSRRPPPGRSLDALPVLARRHAVVVAGRDPDLDAGRAQRGPHGHDADVYRAAVALDVLAARARVAALLQRAGAEVVEAPPDGLAAMCVSTYLRAKTRVRV